MTRGKTALKTNWFCVVTNPNCLKRAELELASLGLRSFTPKKRVWVSHARQRRPVDKPILGRYLFVEVPDGNFGQVRAVNGIESIISICGNPVPIPSRFVEAFIRRQMLGEWDYVSQGTMRFQEADGTWTTRQNRLLERGDRIRVVEGEFNDMLAIVTQRKGRVVTFKLAGANQHGRMNLSSVRAA